jgi:hypothetical protein
MVLSTMKTNLPGWAQFYVILTAIRYSPHVVSSMTVGSQARACTEGLDRALSHTRIPLIGEADCVQLVAMATSSVLLGVYLKILECVPL